MALQIGRQAGKREEGDCRREAVKGEREKLVFCSLAPEPALFSLLLLLGQGNFILLLLLIYYMYSMASSVLMINGTSSPPLCVSVDFSSEHMNDAASGKRTETRLFPL